MASSRIPALRRKLHLFTNADIDLKVNYRMITVVVPVKQRTGDFLKTVTNILYKAKQDRHKVQ